MCLFLCLKNIFNIYFLFKFYFLILNHFDMLMSKINIYKLKNILF
jgi:hypothetical protein